MYQGASTFPSHPTKLSEDEKDMTFSSKVVLALVNTMHSPSTSAIYADNFFTSIKLVEHLIVYKCRYTGTARENRIGWPGLKATKEMAHSRTPRGAMDYKSSAGILALRWKDDKVVALLSTDVGVEPVSTVKRYNKQDKQKKEVRCPQVIKQYNSSIGGIDKSDMLIHLYKTPLRSRRWYLRLYGYVVDVCLVNAWLLYKRDCNALNEDAMPLKKFRLELAAVACIHKPQIPHGTRFSSSRSPSPVSLPRRGQCAVIPVDSIRFDSSRHHFPTYTAMRQTCKACSTQKNIHRTKWMCSACNIALCLYEFRNCFTEYHMPLPGPSPSPGTSLSPSQSDCLV